jgi:hypothetical protein
VKSVAKNAGHPHSATDGTDFKERATSSFIRGIGLSVATPPFWIIRGLGSSLRLLRSLRLFIWLWLWALWGRRSPDSIHAGD